MHGSREPSRSSERYQQTPTFIYHDVRDFRDGYSQEFRNFSDADLISLHGHVSDAANPFLTGSLIRHLRQSSAIVGTKASQSSTRVAVMEGSYGSGYGPLAYNSVYQGSTSVNS